MIGTRRGLNIERSEHIIQLGIYIICSIRLGPHLWAPIHRRDGIWDLLKQSPYTAQGVRHRLHLTLELKELFRDRRGTIRRSVLLRSYDAGFPISGPSEIRMRPCTALPTGSSFSWGGGNGPTCDAPNQFFYISTTSFSRRLTEKVHGPVTRAFYSWTQRQFATP